MKRTFAALLAVCAVALVASSAMAATWSLVGTSPFTHSLAQGSGVFEDAQRIKWGSVAVDGAGNVYCATNNFENWTYDYSGAPSSTNPALNTTNNGGITIFPAGGGSPIAVNLANTAANWSSLSWSGYTFTIGPWSNQTFDPAAFPPVPRHDSKITGAITDLVTASDGTVYALLNWLEINWDFSRQNQGVVAILSDGSVIPIFCPGPAYNYSMGGWNEPADPNKIRGLTAGEDGWVYWWMNGASNFWKYRSLWRGKWDQTVQVEMSPTAGWNQGYSETKRMGQIEYLGNGKFGILSTGWDSGTGWGVTLDSCKWDATPISDAYRTFKMKANGIWNDQHNIKIKKGGNALFWGPRGNGATAANDGYCLSSTTGARFTINGSGDPTSFGVYHLNGNAPDLTLTSNFKAAASRNPNPVANPVAEQWSLRVRVVGQDTGSLYGAIVELQQSDGMGGWNTIGTTTTNDASQGAGNGGWAMFNNLTSGPPLAAGNYRVIVSDPFNGLKTVTSNFTHSGSPTDYKRVDVTLGYKRYWTQAMAVDNNGVAWMSFNSESGYTYGDLSKVWQRGQAWELWDAGVPEAGSIVMGLGHGNGKAYALTLNKSTGVYNLYSTTDLTPQPAPMSLAAIKGSMGVTVTNQTPVEVTHVPTPIETPLGSSGQYMYVREQNRASGIRVTTTGTFPSLQLGDLVNVTGLAIYKRQAGPPVISWGEAELGGANVSVVTSPNTPLKPLTILNRNIGGAAVPFWQSAVAPSNSINTTGQLVRIFGKIRNVVVKTDPTFPSPDADDILGEYFVIDDGSMTAPVGPQMQTVFASAVTTAEKNQRWGFGIRVRGFAPATIGSYVMVTGVVTNQYEAAVGSYPAQIIPVIKPRSAADIVVF